MKEHQRRGNPLSRRPEERFSRKLTILYQDNEVVALNKRAGLLSVPVYGSDAPSAMSLLTAELKPKRQRAYIVHRIDRFTSGILLFAVNGAVRDMLVHQFLAHTPVRQYLTVIRGHLPDKEGTLVQYFRREGMFQKLSTERDPKAARAEMTYSVERRLRGATLVRASLVTGLQNQIRVQFSALGHPVIGDRKYHPSEASESRISRVALHAAHLEFTHPRTGKTLSIDCELPPDMQSLVKSLSPPSARAAK